MKNLAGVRDCDLAIWDELNEAGIEIFQKGNNTCEVPYSLIGRLKTKFCDFWFHRAWYYWSVSCKVPLVVAEELYSNPIGKKDVRVTGHCGCPPPKEWTEIGTDGQKYVFSYDIDSQAGLNLFVETMKKHGLVEKSHLSFKDNQHVQKPQEEPVDVWFSNGVKRVEEYDIKSDFNLETMFLKFAKPHQEAEAVIEQLGVGIKNESEIYFIYLLLSVNGCKGVRQYFFRNNRPLSYRMGGCSGPGWPTVRPSLFDKELLAIFNPLKTLRPKISANLDICLSQLSVPEKR